MRRLIYIPTFLVLLLGGCGLTGRGDLTREVAKDKGAAVADQLLLNAEWWVCYGASIGSLKRRYGQTQATADVLNAYCNIVAGGEGDIIGPGM